MDNMMVAVDIQVLKLKMELSKRVQKITGTKYISHNRSTQCVYKNNTRVWQFIFIGS